MQTPNKARHSGFTLVEMMGIVAIIGLVICVATVRIGHARYLNNRNNCPITSKSLKAPNHCGGWRTKRAAMMHLLRTT
jgi:competence protein ComGC